LSRGGLLPLFSNGRATARKTRESFFAVDVVCLKTAILGSDVSMDDNVWEVEAYKDKRKRELKVNPVSGGVWMTDSDRKRAYPIPVD
jgi:hypothetical protein